MTTVPVTARAASPIRRREARVARASSFCRVADASVRAFGELLRAPYAAGRRVERATLAVLLDVYTDSGSRFAGSQSFRRVV